jgi:hypothetical protein
VRWRTGVQAGEVDIIYSQAAAYFEQDYTAFLRSAARLLKGDGVLIFNHDPVLASAMDEVAGSTDCGWSDVSKWAE